MIFRWESFSHLHFRLLKYSPSVKNGTPCWMAGQARLHTAINWSHGFRVKAQIPGLNIALFAASDWLIPKAAESIWPWTAAADKFFLWAHLQVMRVLLFIKVTGASWQIHWKKLEKLFVSRVASWRVSVLWFWCMFPAVRSLWASVFLFLSSPHRLFLFWRVSSARGQHTHADAHIHTHTHTHTHTMQMQSLCLFSCQG